MRCRVTKQLTFLQRRMKSCARAWRRWGAGVDFTDAQKIFNEIDVDGARGSCSKALGEYAMLVNTFGLADMRRFTTALDESDVEDDLR